MSYLKLLRTLLLSTACATAALAASFGAPLYDTSDPLRVLDSKNFHRVLRKSPKAFVVQFYNSWCGHCIRFAPTFKEFAADVSGWQPAVDVGVINCADSDNSQLCRDNDVQGFPTIKLFWIERGGKGSTKGEKIEARTPQDIQQEIVDFVEKKIKDYGQPRSLPKLTPSSATSISELWDSVPASVKQLFVVVEDLESYVGRQLILDLCSISTAAVVRFLRGSGPEEIRNQDVVSLVLLEKGVHPQLLVTEKDRAKAREVFKMKLAELGYTFQRSNTGTTRSDRKPHNVISNYSKIYLDDLETGIFYTLHQEVPLKHKISQHQLSILKAFVQIMYENMDLPVRIRRYLMNVASQIDVSRSLDGADFPKLLKRAEASDAFLSNSSEFSGCKGSVPGKRGYTCSLWTIFHYATVGSHARFLRQEISNPNYAVLVIKDYIDNFFSCSECVEHFRNMAANIESELVNFDESVLWLWRGHNKVNARLKGDVTEDPERPKVQFPPPSLCEECHSSDAFNESLVLKFLHRFYSSANMVVANDSQTASTAERYSDSTANAKYFSGFDLTIFLVIYAVSITLLLVVFVAVVCRRRKGNFNKTFSFLL